MNKQRLIIVAKNPLLGKVKTRLALTMGGHKALEIYMLLLQHTVNISKKVKTDKVIYFSDYIPTDNETKYFGFDIHLQTGNDLGEKMLHAFEDSFNLGYQSVVIIGSDCYELTTDIVHQAFQALTMNDVIVGPANDGGYYLLGMNKLHKELFYNKTWSSNTLLAETVKDLGAQNLTFSLLNTLSDIDTEEDFKSSSLYLLTQH